MSITYGSVCSGIEAASAAWEAIGWSPAWFSEIEPFPCSVLSHHWPNVKNHGDMTKLAGMVSAGQIPAPDVLVGGTPCQAFSVAGRRGSLDDERGQLTLAFTRLADEIDNSREATGLDKCVIVWENVPGVLSTKDNAFGCFLGELAGSGCELQPAGKRWGNAGCVLGPQRAVAWRVLDAQHFGVAQRRRRVFVVASARNGFDPAAVLFESDGVRRDTAPSRETGQSIARSVAVRTANTSSNGWGISTEGPSYTLDASGGGQAVSVHGTQDPVVGNELAHAMGRNSGQENAVLSVALRGRDGGATAELGDSIAGTLRASGGGGDKPHILASTAVRRLTPVECERLQGFPDNHTAVLHRGKPAADGPRYKAIGNSMAVPVMRWIGQRIERQISGVVEWPDEQHIDAIGQNGFHYETTGTAGDRMSGGDTSQGHERPGTGTEAMADGKQ